jgi:RNA polymerase sigma-70 factor (ECF subfamily)
MEELSDPAVFRTAYDRHSRRVHATALGVLRDPARAEDVVQDVFLRLWRNPDRYDPARGDLGTYLALMARSRALDLWRSDRALDRANERSHLLADREELPEEDRPASAVARRLDRAALLGGIRVLPRPQREAILLHFGAGLSGREVAQATSVPLGTAKARIRLALDKLELSVGPALERP